LLLTAHLLTTVGFILIVTALLLGLTSLSTCILVELFVLYHLNSLCHVLKVWLLGHAKSSFDMLFLGSSYDVRELDLELNKEISLLVGFLMEGHSLVFNSLDFSMFDDLSRCILDSDDLSIQMLESKVHSGQSFNKGDLVPH
jgi:hypothetical protein